MDTRETQAPEVREEALFAKLRDHIDVARRAPYFAEILEGVEAASLIDRAALARLPITRKSDLIEAQKANPPFAGMTAVAPNGLARIFQSPGPIYDAEAIGEDPWRIARALRAAGFRCGDIVHNTFSYHLTPAGRMIESGARALGCAVFAAGIGQTEQQLQAIGHIQPNAYGGTPSFLKILLEKAGGRTSFTKAAVSGEALPPALRAEIKAMGVDVLQFYASADLGLIAYESEAMEGLIVDEDVIVEIVRPGTGDPVAPGEVGEVVVTTFNTSYPLIRFATGDLSAELDGTSPCGRTNRRLKGWMGRADQTTKIKGMFVHPAQVHEVVKRHAEIVKARLVVTNPSGNDVMTLRAESARRDLMLQGEVAETIQSVCKLKGSVELIFPGSLPNDGLVIEDARVYE
ncbi:MAG: phenylacetate--CoA ligase family protein [Magnetovibrionaceae bacterium]